jgi:hypothetical protein
VFLDGAIGQVMPQDGAEAARIGHAHDLAADFEVEVVVLLRRDARRQDAQVAGHAQVHDQRAMVEMDQQVLAAPPGAADHAPGQQGMQALRKRPAQAGVTQHDAADGAPFQMGATPRRVTSTSGNSGMGWRSGKGGRASGKLHMIMHLPKTRPEAACNLGQKLVKDGLHCAICTISAVSNATVVARKIDTLSNRQDDILKKPSPSSPVPCC